MNRAIVAPTAFLRLLTSHCCTAASNPFLGVVALKYAYGRDYLPASWCSLSPCLYYSLAVHKLEKSAKYGDYLLKNLLVETVIILFTQFTSDFQCSELIKFCCHC